MDREPILRWIDGYVAAWNSNRPDEIADLFSADARYYTAPFRQPWTGRDEIVAGWLDRQDAPGDTTFEWHPVVETDDLTIIQGETGYLSEKQTFSNLWVLRFDDDGRCREFTEWWMDHAGQ